MRKIMRAHNRIIQRSLLVTLAAVMTVLVVVARHDSFMWHLQKKYADCINSKFAAARARAADIERSLLRLLINTYRRRRVPQSGQRHAVVRGTTVDADLFLPRDAKYPRY